MKPTRSPHRDAHLEDLIAGLTGQRVRHGGSASREPVTSDPFTRRVRWAAVLLLLMVVAGGTAFVLVRSGLKLSDKPTTMVVPASSNVPLEQWSREHTAGSEAAACLSIVLKGEGNVLEQLRPQEGLAARFHDHRAELTALGAKSRTIGAFRVVKDSYLALPVDFNESGMRLAWFERTREGRWLLDLDSFLGLSDVPIGSLGITKSDGPFLVRGISRPTGGKPAEALSVRSPDGSGTVKVWLDGFIRSEPGLMATLRQTESPVMLLVSRLDQPQNGCSWKVDRLLGKEWFLPVDRRTNGTASSR